MEKRFASIAENAGLYIVITFLGIVVEVGETLLRHIVVVDVVLHDGTIVIQRTTDIGSQSQTDVSVYLSLAVKHRDRHGTQSPDE